MKDHADAKAASEQSPLAKFRRDGTGTYWGSPSPAEVRAIEAHLSDTETVAVVREFVRHGQDGFEIRFFDR